MANRTRKYYRVKVHRYPPFSSINGSYYYYEDVWAYSYEGAENKIRKESAKTYGNNIPCDIKEISKEEFKGDKVITHVGK